ncbi:MAG TPA: EamA family transporter [bacterium]|nr:EamA family transporter [bacterium]
MKSPRSAYPPSVWAALLSVYVVWGSTYLAIRFAVGAIPPFLMGGTRFLAAGAILYAVLRAAGMPRPRAAHWRSTALIGFLLIAVANGGVCWAEQKVPSGVSCLLVATVPIWMVLLDWLWKGNGRPGPRLWAGLLLGFGGTAWLGLSGGEVSGGDPARVLGLAAFPLAWAVGSLYARSAPLPASPLMATALEMLWGGVFQLLAGLVTGEFSQMGPIPALAAWSWVYLTLVGSLVGFTSYIWVLQRSNPALASSYAFVNPVIAVLLGWVFAGEPLTLPVAGATALIVAGVVLITRANPRRARRRVG